MNTRHRAFSVVLIEENLTDARNLREILTAPVSGETFDVFHFECIDESSDSLDDLAVDALMIALKVPDVESLGIIKALRVRVPGSPIVALVPSTNEEFGAEAIRAGAHDCLFKDELDRTRLSRSLRYCIERNRISASGGESAEREVAKKELQALAAMCSPSPLPVARKSFEQASLKEGAPDVFGDLVRHYQDILDHALEERAMRTNMGVVEELKSLADRLGRLGAGSTDVVDLHMATMTAKLHGHPPQKARAYVTEGRLLLLKLMGDLASFYRNLSWGKAPIVGGRLPAIRNKPVQTRDPKTTQTKDGQ